MSDQIKQICKDKNCLTWITHTEAKNQNGYCNVCYLRKNIWKKD